MKQLWLTFVMLCCTGVLLGQSFQVGHTTITFIDSSRSNRSIPTEIYYPADTAGDNKPFSTTISFLSPCISFGHGFVMTWDAYRNIWEGVVPYGYIIAFPKTEGSFSPSHLEFGKDLAFVLRKLKQLGATTGSLFFNKTDTMNCVMGHSMGGGAAILAADLDPSIKSLAPLAAAETTPGAIAAAAGVSVPALIIAGNNDCITPPATNQEPMYAALTSICKHYIGIKGGSHCQMAGSSTTCSFGEASCTLLPTITPATQQAKVNQYLVPWLNFHLRNDCASGRIFDSTLYTDTSVTKVLNCNLCTPDGIASAQGQVIASATPNPFTTSVAIHTGSTQPASVTIINQLGMVVYSATIVDGESLTLSQLTPGVYTCLILSGDTPAKRLLVVKQ